jgi:LCP family protein required for cell wall assembly
MRSRASGSKSETVSGMTCSRIRSSIMPPATGHNAPMQRSSAWVIVGVAVLVLAAVLGFLLFSNRPTVQQEASPSASASIAPSASASLAEDLLARRWTVLFVGTDHSAEREATGLPVNSDAILLASLSADQSQLTLVSLPRDTVDVPLPDGSEYPAKINELYVAEGIDALRAAVEGVFGVPIDAHVVLDMDDMQALIESVDGVDVNPPEALNDDVFIGVHIEAGPQELDPATAMLYLRTRIDQDYGRMRRHQEVIVSLVERLTDPERSIDLQGLLDGFASLETDLPLDELPTLLELARRAPGAEVQNLIVEPPLITFEGDRGDGRGYILEADFEAIRAEVQALIGD